MKKLNLVLGCFILMSFCIVINNTFAANLTWQISKDTAFSMAISQNKKVLLLGGRETCGNCSYMKYTVCESVEPPIKSLIEQYFIPWFCDVDTSTEWYSYASGLGGFTLPLICVIDPTNDNIYEDRTTGIQYSPEFYSRLLQYTSSQTVIGDIDKNGEIDLADGIMALQILINSSSTQANIDADVNDDQRIGLAEALYALQKVAKLRK
jgi:hypothetical protein